MCHGGTIKPDLVLARGVRGGAADGRRVRGVINYF